MNTNSQNILLENQRIIWSLANRYATIRMPAEELFQIGCVKACRCLDEYDSAKGSIANFLHDRLRGVMWHAVNKQYTIDSREVSGRENSNRGDVKRKVEVYNDCEGTTQISCGPLQPDVDISNIVQCMSHDGTLTKTEHRIVKLIFWSEKTHQQIANMLGISKGRVTQLRKRALRKIRRRIDGTQYQSVDKKTARDG